jgi:DNA ligase-1
MNFDKLYAKDKSGRVKEWEVVVSAHPDGTADYTMTHGLQTGKKTPTTRNIIEGKNLGKANETSCFEQACSEARSRWNKQIDKGYRTDVADIKLDHEVENFLPMLADHFSKRGKKISWPAYVQPKLDGFRCLARKRNDEVTLWSRKGKVFDVPKELIAELNEALENEDRLDGELYVHDWRSPTNEADFQRISAAAKKYRPDTALLQYHVYDRPLFGKTFQERFVDWDFQGTQRIRRVETVKVDNEASMMKLYEEWISGALPYEGLMVRNMASPYLFAHRSTDLLKVKPLDDAEFEIIGGQEATGDDIGTVVFKCVAENGEEFDVRPIGTREVRREYFSNLDDYIGQWLTVEFNGRANSGKPRFPRGVKIRPEWDVDLSGKKTSGRVVPKGNAISKAKEQPSTKLLGGFNPFA